MHASDTSFPPDPTAVVTYNLPGFILRYKCFVALDGTLSQKSGKKIVLVSFPHCDVDLVLHITGASAQHLPCMLDGSIIATQNEPSMSPSSKHLANPVHCWWELQAAECTFCIRQDRCQHIFKYKQKPQNLGSNLSWKASPEHENIQSEMMIVQ
jgi:hypothetical protein